MKGFAGECSQSFFHLHFERAPFSLNKVRKLFIHLCLCPVKPTQAKLFKENVGHEFQQTTFARFGNLGAIFFLLIALNALFIPIFSLLFFLFQCMKISTLGSPVTFSRLKWYVSIIIKTIDKLDQRN